MGENFFPLKMFGLTVPRIVVEEPFSVSKKKAVSNFLCRGEGGGLHDIVEKCFRFRGPKQKS